MTQTQVNFHIHTQAEAASNFYAKIAILETFQNDMNGINWNCFDLMEYLYNNV